MYLFPIILDISLHVFNEAMMDRQRFKNDQLDNNRTCNCFTKLYKTYGTLNKKTRDELGNAINLNIMCEVKWKEL